MPQPCPGTLDFGQLIFFDDTACYTAPSMRTVPGSLRGFFLPLLTFGILATLWWLASTRGWLDPRFFPTPQAVGTGFGELFSTGRIWRDLGASLLRVGVAYAISIGVGVPLGLWLGQWAAARQALLPLLNFLRALSPLAWIPFAVLWFGAGDVPVIFLITMATLPPAAVTTAAAVASVPRVYFRVAKDYGIRGAGLLTGVMLPAVMPGLITTLRLTMGLSWLVLAAAEMIAGQTGLGFLIQDANNGLRTDLILAGMIVLGTLGILTDRLLMLLTKIPSVRWGYDR
jgi:NitT/TauT family transport system permease protein